MLNKPESVVRDSIKQRKLKMRKFFISKLSRFQRILPAHLSTLLSKVLRSNCGQLGAFQRISYINFS